MLSSLLKEKIRNSKLTIRTASKIIGVSHTTLLRAMSGEIVDLSTLQKFSRWLDIKPTELLDVMLGSSSPLADRIAVVLKNSPKLANAFEDVMKAIIDGKTSPNLVEDIAAYAAFRLDLIGKSKP